MYSINGNYTKKNYLRKNYEGKIIENYEMTDAERAALQQAAKDQGGYTSNTETITEKTGSLDISIDKVENVDIIDERTSYFKEREIIDIENVTEVTREIQNERSYTLEESVYKYEGKQETNSFGDTDCCNQENVLDGYNVVAVKENQYNYEFNGCPIPKDPNDADFEELGDQGDGHTFEECKQKCDSNEQCNTFEINGCSGGEDNNPSCSGQCYLYKSGEDGIKNDTTCETDGSIKTYKMGPSVKRVLQKNNLKGETLTEGERIVLEPSLVETISDNPTAELYEACNYDVVNYKKHSFGPGEYRDIRELGMRTGGYGVSAIRLSAGTGLYVYSQPNFKGASWGPILGPVELPCLVHHGWNDRIYSFIVTRERGKVELFQHCGYNGYKVEYGIGEYPDISNDLSIGKGGARINDLSAIRVGKDLNLIIYDGTMFKGASKVIKGPADLSCLVHQGWNDRIESIRVQPKEMKKEFSLKHERWSDLLEESPNKVIRRICQDCRATHQYTYWKAINNNWKEIKHHGISANIKDLFLNTWFNQNNNLNQDFRLYSDYVSTLEDKNRWSYCNYNDPGIGFPRDCGPNSYVPYQWNSKGDKTRGYPWNTYGATRIQYSVEAKDSTKENPKWIVLFEDPYFVPVDTETGKEGCTFSDFGDDLTVPRLEEANIVIDNFGELYLNGKFISEVSGADGDLSVIPEYPELEWTDEENYPDPDGKIEYKKLQIVVRAMDAGGPGMFAGWFKLDKGTRLRNELEDGTVEMTPIDEFWTNSENWKCYRVKDDIKIEEAFSEAYPTNDPRYKHQGQGRFERIDNQTWSTIHGNDKSVDGNTLNNKFTTLFPGQNKSNFQTLKLHEFKNFHTGEVYSQPITGFISKDTNTDDSQGGKFYRGVMCFKDVNVQSFWYYPEDQLIIWEGVYLDVPDKNRKTVSNLKWYGKVSFDKVIKDSNLINLGDFGSGVDINTGVTYPGGGGAWNSNWNTGKTKDEKCKRIWQDCQQGQCGEIIGQSKYKENNHNINDDYRWFYYVLEIPLEKSHDCSPLNKVVISPKEVRASLQRRSLTSKDLPGQCLWKYVKDRKEDENRFTWSGRIYNCMKGGENCGDELTDEGGAKHNAITYLNDDDGVGTFNKLITPNRYSYKQLGPMINTLNNIVFEVTAKNDAHIALGETTGQNDKHYEIVIGGWGNAASVIRSKNQGQNLVTHYEKILKRDMINGLKWDYYRVTQANGTFESTPFKSNFINEPVHYWWNTNNVLDSGIKDYIGFHITGYFNVEKSGKYKFRVRTDDGFKMSIGGQSVISSYRLQAPTYRYSSWVELEANNYYDLDIRWYEWGGHADMELEWHNEEETVFYKIPKQRFWSLSQEPAPQKFWISWNDNLLKVGKGEIVGESEFMKISTSSYNYQINYALVSTGWGSEGNWKLLSSTGRTDVITKQTADLLCNNICYWYGKEGTGSSKKNFIDSGMCDCSKGDDPFGCNEKDDKCATAINFNAEPVNCSVEQPVEIDKAWPGDENGNGKIEVFKGDNLMRIENTVQNDGFVNMSLSPNPSDNSQDVPRWLESHKNELLNTVKQVFREETEANIRIGGDLNDAGYNSNSVIDYDAIKQTGRYNTIVVNINGPNSDNNYRPKAIGFIDTQEQQSTNSDGVKSYYQRGAVYFTDDKIYKFWYYNREAIIYWDKNKGTHFWKGQLGTSELPEGCLPQYEYNKMYTLTRDVEFQKNLTEEINSEKGNVKMSKISSLNVSFNDDTNLLEVDILDPKVKELIRDAFPDYYTSDELAKNKEEANKKLIADGGELSKDKVSSSLNKNAIGQKQLTGSAYYCSYDKDGKSTFVKGPESVSSAIGNVKKENLNENFEHFRNTKYTIDGSFMNNKVIETLETYLTSRINDNEFKKINSKNIDVKSESGTSQSLPNDVSDDFILELRNISNINNAKTNVTKVLDLVSSGESVKLSLYAKGTGEMELFIYNGTEGNNFGQTKFDLKNEWQKYDMQYPFSNTSECFIGINLNSPSSTIYVTGITIEKLTNVIEDGSDMFLYDEDKTLINCKLMDPYPENPPIHEPDVDFSSFTSSVKQFCNSNDKCSGFLLIPPEKQNERNKVFQVDTKRTAETEEPKTFVPEEPPSCGTAGVIPTGKVIKNLHETRPDIGSCGCQNACNEDPTCGGWYYYKEDDKNFCKFTDGNQLDVVNKNYYGSLSLQRPDMNNLQPGNTREIITGKDASGSVETGSSTTETSEGGGISLIFIIFIVCFILVYLVISKMY